MDELTREKFEQIKAANPGAECVPITVREPGGAEHGFVFKVPPRAEWQRARSMLEDPAKKGQVGEALVFGCLLYPSPEEMRALIERRPAWTERIAGKLIDLAGAADEVVEKKF